MADTTQKYQIQQKTADGMLTLHPETEGNIVVVTPAEGKFTSTNAQAALEELGGKIATIEAGTVTDVKVKLGDAEATSVVTDGVATVDVSTKVDKETGKGLSTNDYTTDEKNKLAGITEGANKVEASATNGSIKIDGTDTVVYDDSGKQDKITDTNKLSADLVADGTTNHVFTADDDTKLTGIAEGATKVEASTTNGNIKINGTETVVYTPEALPEYSMVKDETASEGYASTYHLTKDGTNVGAAINIPKDMVVESGSVKVCTEADVPVKGYKVGDKYIDLVLANATSSHIYILVTDLVDDYTAGTGIDITSRVVSIDRTTVDTWYDAAGTASGLVTALENGQVKTNADNITTLQGTVGDSTKGLVKDVADLQAVGATKTEASTTNGNIKINGTETTVYTLPTDVVKDSSYAHITVTETTVSDGTTTLTKYDDTALAARVKTLEDVGATKVEASETNGNIKINGTETQVYDDTAVVDAIGDSTKGLTKAVNDLNAKFTGAVKAGTYSVVQTNDSGIVTAAGQIMEVGTEGQTTPSDALVTGGLFFKRIS